MKFTIEFTDNESPRSLRALAAFLEDLSRCEAEIAVREPVLNDLPEKVEEPQPEVEKPAERKRTAKKAMPAVEEPSAKTEAAVEPVTPEPEKDTSNVKKPETPVVEDLTSIGKDDVIKAVRNCVQGGKRVEALACMRANGAETISTLSVDKYEKVFNELKALLS